MNLDEGWQRPRRFGAWGAILGAPLGWLIARQFGLETLTAPMLGCWAGALAAAALSRPESVWLWLVTGTAMALTYVTGGFLGVCALMYFVWDAVWAAAWWIGANVVTLAVVGVLHGRDYPR